MAVPWQTSFQARRDKRRSKCLEAGGPRTGPKCSNCGSLKLPTRHVRTSGVLQEYEEVIKKG